MPLPDFVPTSDKAVKRLVRTVTDYSDDADQLPEATLDELLDVAKLRLYNEVGADEFYDDSGLGQALVFTVAILAKARIENYSVTSWSIGDQRIDTSGVRDGDAEQFQRWTQMVADGISASDDGGPGAPSSTTEYIGGWD